MTERSQPKVTYKRDGIRYAVLVDGDVAGYVWHTTSGRVWGALSCSPRTKVWAWARRGLIAEGSSGTRAGAAAQMLQAPAVTRI